MNHTKRVLSGMFDWRTALLAVLTIWFFFPAVETRSFPAVRPAHEVSYDLADGGTNLTLEAIKERDCKWAETRIYLGSRGGDYVYMPDAGHREAPTLRGIGLLRWEKTFLPLTASSDTEAFADAFHYCYGLDWPMSLYRTKSVFFDLPLAQSNDGELQ